MADGSSSAQVKHLRVEKSVTESSRSNDRNHKLLLQSSRDSGYFSPVTPGTTPGTTPDNTAPKNLEGQTHRSNSSPSTVSDRNTDHGMQKLVNPHVSGRGVKRTLSSPCALESAAYGEAPSLPVPQAHCPLINHQSNRMMLEQQNLVNFSCDSSSVLFLAYKCKELNQLAWKDCKHPYCVQVRNNLQHAKTCFNGRSGDCKRCLQFESQLYRHAETCNDNLCPVESCRSIKQELQYQFGYLPYDQHNPLMPAQHHQPVRRSSFAGVEQYYAGADDQSSMLYSLSQFESTVMHEDTPTSRYIGARAEEIVTKLDQEEPLLPPPPPPEPPMNANSAPLTSLGRPGSLRTAGAAPNEEALYQPISMLSPIVERSEDSPSFPTAPQLWGMQSMSLMSYELDGVISQGSKTMPSISMNSLGGQDDNLTEYPKQSVLHKLRDDYLTLGADGHYFQCRDYNANEDFKSGGFGNVRAAEDLTNKHLFAIKCNNKDDESFLESIETEARMLARLGPHVNVVHMYGAVMDVKESAFHPTRMYKLMMELAEHGNLSEMLVDPETLAPMPLDKDQALYYFWQLLRGVNFLHTNGVLHLDIKGSNVLVFDEGRTMKICDFGTAVHIDEVARSVGKNLGTPQFAAPEICKQQLPRFSSDIWSTMCVLVEMLTTKMPWDSDMIKHCPPHAIIFKVGNYSDEQMETDLIPGAEALDQDVIELMRLAFRAKCEDRVTAVELLNHPLIVNAYAYEAYFDEALNCDDEDENVPSQLNEDDDDIPYASHMSAPTSLPLGAPCPEDSAPPGGEACFQQSKKRDSKDSCLDMEMDQDVQTPCSQRRISSARNSDSGLDTPFTNSGKFKFSISTCIEESASDVTDVDRDILDHTSRSDLRLLTPFTPSDGTCRSLPNPQNTTPQFDPDKVQRSYSLTLSNARSPSSPYPSLTAQFGSSYASQKERQQPYNVSYSRLRHSNSAPVIGGQLGRRRLSLQLLHSYDNEEAWSGMRRTSSEVYVDRGPDIDSPESIHMWAQSVLSKDSTTDTRSRLLSPSQPHNHLAPTRHTHFSSQSQVPSCDETVAIPSSNVSVGVKEVSQYSNGVPASKRSRKVGGQEEMGVASNGAGLGSDTEVKKHKTLQGKTFETYKTVC